MPRKSDRQRKIDRRPTTTVVGGENVGPPTTPTTGPAVPTQPGPTGLTVASNVLMFSAVTPLALIGLTWDAPPGIAVASYLVEAATDSGFTTGLVRRTVYQASASLELPTGTLYYFRVSAITAFVQSAPSATVSATTATDTSPPAVPASLSAVFNSAGDLEVSWVNPTSANFRDVEVSIYADSGFSTLLFRAYTSQQRLIWTAAQNRLAGSGAPDPTLYVRMASRSWTGVLSATAVPAVQPVKAVPANVGSLTQSWSGDAGTAPADLVISWATASGASFYRLTIDGVSRDVFGLRYVYPLDQNRSEHSGTPDPVLSLSVVGVDGLDQVSGTATTATATNAAPAAPSVSLTAFFSTLAISVTSVLPPDGREYRFRLIQTSPSAGDITWYSQSQLQTRAISASATYQVGVSVIDVFGQLSTETLTSAIVTDALTLADLRAAARYSDQASTSATALKAILADGQTALTTPTWIATTPIAIANAATSVQQTPSSLTQQGDILWAHVVARGDSQTIPTPSGWAAVSGVGLTETSNTPDVTQALFWREAGATETAAYTFTCTVSNSIGVTITTTRGLSPIAPANASAGQTNASSVTITAPTITTTVKNTLLLFVAATGSNQATTPGGSLVERWEQSGGTNVVSSYGADEAFATPGATGTRTATQALARASIGALVALAPRALGVASNAGWVAWVRHERDLLERYRTITLAMDPVAGTTTWYIRTSADGTNWRYWAGPVVNARTLTEVAGASAAQAAAISAATLGGVSATRVDLPAQVEARYVELWLRNTTSLTQLTEFYPRRLVQSDDIEAESIRAINVAVGSLTADRLSVNQLSAIAADLGTITAGTITGATIQTAASGARIELTSANGLRSFDSGGVLQAQLRTDNGELYLGAGEIRAGSYGLRIEATTSYLDTRSLQFYDFTNSLLVGKLQTSNLGGGNGAELLMTAQHPTEPSHILITAWAQTAADEADAAIIARSGTSGAVFASVHAVADTTSRIDLNADAIVADGTYSGTASDSSTTSRPVMLALDHNSSGIPTTGFGVEVALRSESSTTLSRDLATMSARWANATDATRRSELVFLTFDATTFRVPLTLSTTGSAAAIGFLGAAAVARQTVTGSRGGNAALASLLTALATLGLITDSSSA